jgi:Tfp pilus assembly protein PilO
LTPLLKRIFVEKRIFIIPLAVGLAANLLAYFIIVRPLGIKSAGAAERAATAAAALRTAEQEMAAARALVEGKSTADEELSAFYQKVLPANQDAARRMTYASLPALATRAHVRYGARTTGIDTAKGVKDQRLGRMTIRMVLQGEYESLRQFLFELESAPEFVIIDDVAFVEATGSDTLTLTVNMSTYYRLETNGT